MNADELNQVRKIVSYYNSKKYADFTYSEVGNIFLFSWNGGKRGFYCNRLILDGVVNQLF